MRHIITSIIACFLLATPLIAQETNNITDYNPISETQEGVTITIERAYADTAQIAVWYTIDGLELPEGQLTGAPIIHFWPVLDNHPPEAIGSGGGGIDFFDSGQISGYSQFELNTDVGDTLDVQFEVKIKQFEGMPLWVVPEDTVIDGRPDDEYIYTLPYDLTFMLPATLSPRPTQIIDVGYTGTSNDLTLSIGEITLTPIFARVPVCFDLPDSEHWEPNMSLLVDDVHASPSGFSLDTQPTLEDTSRCVSIEFTIPYVDNTQTLTIVVDGLQSAVPTVPTQDDILQAQRYLAEHGIMGIYSNSTRGINYELVSKPENMPEVDANRMMFDALRERWPGEWSVEIDLNTED